MSEDNNTMDLAFTDSVKQLQSRKGSRDAYKGSEWPQELSAGLIEFIGAQKSCFISTVSSDGQPYMQHRGGPAGFLHVLDKQTIAFADFKGNRQYLSQGNLADNPKAFMYLLDYSQARRIKVWGEARVVEDDPDLIEQLMPADYDATPEQAIIFDVKMWSANCRQHIPILYPAEDVAAALNERDLKIKELEEEIARLSAAESA